MSGQLDVIVGLHMHVRGAREWCTDHRACEWVVGDMLMGAWMLCGCVGGLLVVERDGELADKGGRKEGQR